MRRVVIHINSYFIASRLHSELVTKLDDLKVKQVVFVPVDTDRLINRNKPLRLNYSEIVYKHCYNNFDRYLWPLKMLKIWSSFKSQKQYMSLGFIHAHTLIANGLIAYWAFRKWGVPYIVSIRYTDIYVFMQKFWFFRKMGLEILKHASAVMFLSPAYKNIQIRSLCSSEMYQTVMQKSYVIPNGINDFWTDHRQKKTVMCNQPTIIFVGNIDKRKNLKTLLGACEILNKRGFKVTVDVIGDGPLLNSIKNASYITKVRFFGNISDKEILLKRYRQADLLVVPSLIESFGLVYPEAMSQGLPVIFSKDQGFDGFFPDGHVGYAANATDPEDIANKIKLVFSDYRRISDNAYKESKEFSWDNVSRKLINVYTEMEMKMKS